MPMIAMAMVALGPSLCPQPPSPFLSRLPEPSGHTCLSAGGGDVNTGRCVLLSSPYVYTYAHKCRSSACKVEDGYECQEVPDSDKRLNNKPDRITGVCARVNVCAMLVRGCVCVCFCMCICARVCSCVFLYVYKIHSKECTASVNLSCEFVENHGKTECKTRPLDWNATTGLKRDHWTGTRPLDWNATTGLKRALD